MARIILTVSDAILKEVTLTKMRFAIGCHPQSDLIVDSPAISGPYAVIVAMGKEAFIEDLDSTNGTQVNGQPVKKHFLQDEDVIEPGKHIAFTKMLTTISVGQEFSLQ